MSVHKLNNNFRLFFHDPLSYNWTIDSYITITDISSIEQYWEINVLLNEYLHLGMFFLMRENINPLWNETNNNYSFSIKVPKHEALWYWNYFSSHLLSENFFYPDYKENWKSFNGISISPKKHFCIIKIWLSKIIKDDIKNIYKIPTKYTGDILIKKYN